MIFSNKELVAVEKNFEFGKIYQVGMGERGRGRCYMALTCPKDTIINVGLNPELTIGPTKSARPRIKRMVDDTLYMMLSAEGGYTRRGNGTIKVLESQIDEFEVLAAGNGADGDAGRIGYWDCMLLKAPRNGIVRVRTSGAGYGTPSDLYVIHKNEVYHCYLWHLEECCESLGIEVPCAIEYDVEGCRFGNDWVTL